MRLPPRRPAVFAAAVLVIAGVGCRAVADRAFERPTLTFSGATLRNASLNGGEVDVLAVVHNPNPYPLHAARVRYRLLAADSAEIGTGEATDSLSVGARDSATLVLPVHVTLPGLVRAGVGVIGGAATTGDAEYRVLGEVVLAHTPVGDVRVPLDVRGRARLR
ncbi:MAG TPA: LEA type 2 family protein [Gemmatirosa sp.]